MKRENIDLKKFFTRSFKVGSCALRKEAPQGVERMERQTTPLKKK